jgi:hypothetical protein
LTVIVDPSGAPAVVYSQDVPTIDTITAAGTDQASATPIVQYGAWTIVKIEDPGSNAGVVLPSTAQVGDVVEVHYYGTHTCNLYPNVGYSIEQASANSPVFPGNFTLRLMPGNDWEPV